MSTVLAGSEQGVPRPVILEPGVPGDFPDPSVIRVGRDYWATATTSQWAPMFPLLHSTDLVNWRVAGAVFQTPPAWSAGSYWAPEIAQDGGRFFVYYTARKKDGPLCVAVADAAQARRAIHRSRTAGVPGRRLDRCGADPRRERPPLSGVEGRRQQPQAADAALGAATFGRRPQVDRRASSEILRNEAPWEAHLVEGPYILRRGDWFYMFYSADACCGRRCNYKLGVARSRKLLGTVGTLTRQSDSRRQRAMEVSRPRQHRRRIIRPHVLLYHAYDASTFEFVGRQALLDEVTWNAQGWPAINGGTRSVRVGGAAIGSRLNVARLVSIDDDFDGAALDPGWQWPWDQTPAPTIEPKHAEDGCGSTAERSRPSSRRGRRAAAATSRRNR